MQIVSDGQFENTTYIHYDFFFACFFPSQLDKYIPMKSSMTLIQKNKFIEIDIIFLKNDGGSFDHTSWVAVVTPTDRP